MKKILFFDDFFIHRQESIRRVFHSPRWLEDRIYTDGDAGYGVGYSSVVRGPGDRRFLYYITVLDEKEELQRLTALRRIESSDGLNWEPQTLVDIMTGVPVPAGCCIYRDEHEADEKKRFKMTNSPVKHVEGGIETIPSTVFTSVDGTAWALTEGAFLPHHSDTFNALLWNPITRRYQITLRRKWGERRICLVESEDLQSWSDPRTIVHPDSLDAPSTHFYGMPQFHLPSSELFVGFLWNQRMPYNDVMGGPVQTEYAYSYDGLMWNRTHHISMPLREPGSFGGGSMYGAALLEENDSMVVYAVGRQQDHSVESPGGLIPGLLRKDGFVSLKSAYGAGEITTECLLLGQPELSINVRAPFGGVSAQLCDPQYRPIPGYTYEDCCKIDGDHTCLKLAWHGRSDLSEFVKRKLWVRLQLRMNQSELFSIQGEFSFNINVLAPL